MVASNFADQQATVENPGTRTIRSDVAERAESLFRRNGHLLHQNISCDYHGGVLILRGVVPSYYLKQVAQEVVASLEDGVRIENRMEVPASDAANRSDVEWTGMVPE